MEDWVADMLGYETIKLYPKKPYMRLIRNIFIFLRVVWEYYSHVGLLGNRFDIDRDWIKQQYFYRKIKDYY